MHDNLRAIQALGQSLWYDNLSRALLRDGTLAAMIRDDAITGVTSNPTIFEQAITGSGDYDADLTRSVRAHPGRTAQELFLDIACEDVGAAADLLLPVYQASGERDGMVSIEVSPELAHDTEATVARAEQLFERLARPNVMIKVPATRAGLPAIERLIDAGVNVNVTLLFSVTRYIEVVESFMLGLESRLRRGQPLGHVASVASFFVSRVDSAVDKAIDARLAEADTRHAALAALRGTIAIANAKLAYREYQALFDSPRFAALRTAGAQVQRLLWASTGVKDPAYRDVRYVEELIGADTVNTLPPKTLQALKDHGRVAATLTADVDAAAATVDALAAAGIDLDVITRRLEEEGVAKFQTSYRNLLNAIQTRTAQVANVSAGR